MLINEYIEQVEKVYYYPKIPFLFRGHANARWLLESSAFRRIHSAENIRSKLVFEGCASLEKAIEESKDKEKSFILNLNDGGIYIDLKNDIIDSFIEYNKNLIEKATLKGYPSKDFQNSSDLQILINLQHFGAATCLVDFTKNFLKALWFACQEDSKNANGTVFVVRIENIKEITSTDLSKPIEKFLGNNDLWFWSPENINNRTFAQDSVCIFGMPIFGDNLSTQKINILSKDKETLLYELDILFNINYDTIYPDFYGFSLSQAATQPLQLPVNYSALLNYVIKSEKWEDAETILINHPYLLTIGIVTILIKNERWKNAETILINHPYLWTTGIVIILIENERWKNAETILINRPCLLTTRIISILIKKDLEIKNILTAFQKGPKKNDEALYMFADIILSEQFPKDRFIKHLVESGYHPDNYYDGGCIEFFNIFFYKSINNLIKHIYNHDSMSIQCVEDNDFNILKENIIAFCRHKSVPKELKLTLKDVLVKAIIPEIRKNEIIQLFD